MYTQKLKCLEINMIFKDTFEDVSGIESQLTWRQISDQTATCFMIGTRICVFGAVAVHVNSSSPSVCNSV